MTTSAVAIASYAVGSVAAWLIVGAWQRATLAGPAYKERREHMAHCHVCEHPTLFWVSGYSCYAAHGTGEYPFALSPWALIGCMLFWPLVPPIVVGRLIQARLADRMSRYVEVQQLRERDRAEVERLMSEL